MKQVVSFQAYKELTKAAKEKGLTASNCFFLPNVIRDKTEKGKLFFQEIDGGLLLFEDNGFFYRVYYFLRPDRNPTAVDLNLDSVIELPFQSELNSEQLKQQSQILKMGFHLGRKSALMSIPADSIKISEKILEVGNVAFAEEKDLKAVDTLLRNSFDPLYAFLPDEADLLENIRNNKVWILRDGSETMAVLNSNVEKNAAIISHVAVAPDYRGRGYGRLMVEVYHRYYKSKVNFFRHWVGLNNSPAVSMYQSFGYQFTVRRANEYVFKI